MKITLCMTFTRLLPHKAEVAKFSNTKVVAKAVPDGEVGDEDQHENKLEAESPRVN